jgi:hypothetical protein
LPFAVTAHINNNLPRRWKIWVRYAIIKKVSKKGGTFMLPEAFLERIAKYPIKQFVFHHIGPLWTDGKEKILEDAVSALPFPVLVARDGSKLEI